MNRYGMRYSTIRYAQRQATWLHRATGWPHQFHSFKQHGGCPALYIGADRTARSIAQDAIMLAAVLTPAEIRKALS